MKTSKLITMIAAGISLLPGCRSPSRNIPADPFMNQNTQIGPLYKDSVQEQTIINALPENTPRPVYQLPDNSKAQEPVVIPALPENTPVPEYIQPAPITFPTQESPEKQDKVAIPEPTPTKKSINIWDMPMIGKPKPLSGSERSNMPKPIYDPATGDTFIPFYNSPTQEKITLPPKQMTPRSPLPEQSNLPTDQPKLPNDKSCESTDKKSDTSKSWSIAPVVSTKFMTDNVLTSSGYILGGRGPANQTYVGFNFSKGDLTISPGIWAAYNFGNFNDDFRNTEQDWDLDAELKLSKHMSVKAGIQYWTFPHEGGRIPVLLAGITHTDDNNFRTEFSTITSLDNSQPGTVYNLRFSKDLLKDSPHPLKPSILMGYSNNFLGAKGFCHITPGLEARLWSNGPFELSAGAFGQIGMNHTTETIAYGTLNFTYCPKPHCLGTTEK